MCETCYRNLGSRNVDDLELRLRHIPGSFSLVDIRWSWLEHKNKGWYREVLMYFPAEQFIAKLEISPEQLGEFEQRGIVQGIRRAGRVFYSSRDLYRLKGILSFTKRGMSCEEAADRVDHPVRELTAAGNSQ
jgi:hypothetical protein